MTSGVVFLKGEEENTRILRKLQKFELPFTINDMKFSIF